jgi:hypothetical protein
MVLSTESVAATRSRARIIRRIAVRLGADDVDKGTTAVVCAAMRSRLAGLLECLERHKNHGETQSLRDNPLVVEAVRDFHDATVRCLMLAGKPGSLDDVLFDGATLLALEAGSEQVRRDLLRAWHVEKS